MNRSSDAASRAPRVLLLHAFGDSPSVIPTALRVARNAVESLSDVDVQVVVQGTAVTGVTVEGGFEDDLATAMDEGLDIVACANSMRRAGVDPDQVIPGVGTVPAAVVHLAERQWAGAAYVRI